MRSILFKNVKNVQNAKISEWYSIVNIGIWQVKIHLVISRAMPKLV